MSRRKDGVQSKKFIKARKWMLNQLYAKYQEGHGRAKHAIKDIHNSTPYIHSNNTYETYKGQCNHFGDWLTERAQKLGDSPYDKDKAWDLIPEYMKSLEEKGMSSWTISCALSAIAKAYGVSTTEIDYKAPKRERSKMKRSRNVVTRDAHFSEDNNRDLVTVLSCCGLRRHEVKALHGSDFGVDEDGNAIIHVKSGKGGKSRNVILHGSDEELKCVTKVMSNAGSGLVFPDGIHSACDVHHYRAVYAWRAYSSKERNPIPKEDRYVCRKDKKGVVYDKKAMLYASQQLGHNRIDVIASSYLYDL